MKHLYFRKSQRIVSRKEFSRILSHKCFACKGMLRLYKAPNNLDVPRFGVTVSTSCGPAVVRNRLKRLGREVFRLHQHAIPTGYDYILIFTRKKPKIKSSAANSAANKSILLSFQDLELSFSAMIKHLREKSTY